MTASNKELEKQSLTKAHEIDDLRQQMTATQLKHEVVEKDNESLMLKLAQLAGELHQSQQEAEEAASERWKV